MNARIGAYVCLSVLLFQGCAQVDNGSEQAAGVKYLEPSRDESTQPGAVDPGMSANIGSTTDEQLQYPAENGVSNDGVPSNNPNSKTESCLGDLTYDEALELADLSDPDTLIDEYDAQRRVNQIAYIFARAEDPRGLFATVYRLITNRAVESVDNGDYEYPQWARDLIVEFARRYLSNLHGHLTGDEVTGQWARYYALARNCNVGRGRTLGVAIAVHLMVDLPKTLYQIDSRPEQRDDFVLFGDILLEIFPDLITDIARDYRTDVRDLLRGFFLGEWVDRLTSEGSMTAFMYQGIRLKAWRDGQNYRRFPRSVVDLEVRLAWGAADLALAKLDAVGAL